MESTKKSPGGNRGGILQSQRHDNSHPASVAQKASSSSTGPTPEAEALIAANRAAVDADVGALAELVLLYPMPAASKQQQTVQPVRPAVRGSRWPLAPLRAPNDAKADRLCSGCGSSAAIVIGYRLLPQVIARVLGWRFQVCRECIESALTRQTTSLTFFCNVIASFTDKTVKLPWHLGSQLAFLFACEIPDVRRSLRRFVEAA